MSQKPRVWKLNCGRLLTHDSSRMFKLATGSGMAEGEQADVAEIRPIADLLRRLHETGPPQDLDDEIVALLAALSEPSSSEEGA